MPTLLIQLFGNFRLKYGDEPITSVRSSRLQSLLAYLLVHRHAPQSRQQIAFLFWPDSTDAQARTNLRNLLHRLCSALPEAPNYLQINPQTLQWRSNPPLIFDVAKFEQAVAQAEQGDDPTTICAALEAAARCYQGDLLPGCYDDWILPERERFSQTFTQVVERLIQLYTEQHDFTAAIGYAQRLVQYDPLVESAHLHLMNLHALNGDRASALRVYHTCATTLQHELGVEPGPPIREIYNRLLNVESQTTLPEPAPTILSTMSPLVGRQAEWKSLQAAWQAAASGQPQLAVVSGETGIGKTRLVEELLVWASRQDIRTAHADCYATEGGLAYAPVTSWLRTPALSTALSTLEDVWLVEIARLLPKLRVEHPAMPAPTSLTDSLQRERLFEALSQAFLAAHQPLLLQIDDLQWCDHETLQWLHHLLRFEPQARLLIVGTVRPEEITPNHPLSSLLIDLNRSQQLTEIELEPLNAGETASLAAQMIGQPLEPSQAVHLYTETEGNPLFIMETVHACWSRGAVGSESTESIFTPASQLSDIPTLPPKVRSAIVARLAQLSPVARELAGVAAIVGREFTFAVLTHAGDSDEEAVVRGLDELWQRRIVRERERDAYAFSHDKLREVICAGLSPPRRIDLHRKVAAALETVYKGNTAAVAARLAHHYSEAGAAAPAIDYWLGAGDQAHSLFAHQEAIDCYQRALALLKEQQDYGRASRTLMRLGLTYHTAFDFKAARRAYDEGFTLWQATGEYQPAILPEPAPHALRVDWLDPPTLDPTKADNFWSAGVISQFFRGLVELNAEMEVLPDLALSWEVLACGCKYLFHLRDDVCWSDGTPVTAGDFEYAWKRALSAPSDTLAKLLLSEIKGAKPTQQDSIQHAHRSEHVEESNPAAVDPERVAVQALNETTLSIELEEPTPYLPHALAHPATFAIPKHVVEVQGDAWAEPKTIVTNGPFKLESWQPEERMVFVRNPAYRGRFTGNLQRVELQLCRDPLAKLALYEADEMDVLSAWFLPPQELDLVRQRYAGDYISAPHLTTIYVAFDLSQPPFDDSLVRLAFTLATDRELYANVLRRGHYFPATGGFVPAGIPGHSPEIAVPFEPDRARELLAQAGYPGGRGFPHINLLASDFRAKEGRHLAAQWREHLGVEITCTEVDQAISPDILREIRPDISLTGWVADYPDPDSFLRVCMQSTQPGWHNEAYEKLVAQARCVADQTERTTLYQAADKILVEDAAIIPLTYTRAHLLMKPWVKRFPIALWAGIRFYKDVVIEPHKE